MTDAISARGGQAIPAVHPVYLPPEPNRFSRAMTRLYMRTPTWAAPAAIAACFAGTAAYVLAMDPTDNNATTAQTCVVKLTTGFDCPGCGGTRAFFYLMQGNVPAAARHHMLAVFAAPFLVWMYAAWAVKLMWGKQMPMPRITAAGVSIFLGVWVAFSVARNLPWPPFTYFFV